MSALASRIGQWRWPRWSWPRLAHPLGLQTRIALLVSSGLVALMTLFVVLGLAALRESTDRVFQERALLAQMAAEHLDFVLQQAGATVGWTGHELAEPVRSGGMAAAHPLLESVGRRLAFIADSVLLFDPSGRLVDAFPLQERPAPDLGGRILEKLGGGATQAVDWVRTPQGPTALVVVPLSTPDGERVGYLGAAIDFSGNALGHWLQQMALGKSGRVDLVGADGSVLTSTGDQSLPSPDSHASYFTSLMSSRRATVTTCYSCHASSQGASRDRDIMAFAPLTITDWGVVLRQSEDEVMEPTRRLQQQVLGLGAVSLLVALFMVWLTTRSIVGPIRALTLSARRIAEGNLGEAVAVEGSDEVGELGRTLDYMRARLQRSMEEIKACNAELDRRVRERTAELERSKDDLERSRDHLETLIDRLSTLHSIAVDLNQSLELQPKLNGALVNALKLAGMDAGAIYLLDESTGELELVAHHGLSLEAARVAANLGLSASLCAAAAQVGEPIVVEDTGRYVRGSKSVLRSENIRCMVRVPFKSTRGLLGTMCLAGRSPRTFSRSEMELLTSVSNQIAVAVQNARLYEELQRKERMRGELLLKVIAAQEEERKRIARELHDQTSQALAALAVAVETAAGQAAEGGDVSVSLARMRSLAVSTLEEVHRLIFDLRPTLLDDLGLIAAMRWYAETRLGEVGIKVRLEVAGEEKRLAPQIETALYRVVQEAVNNVANHSGAQNVTITLVLKPEQLLLTIVDDGWGFDMGELARSGDRKRGLGLMGMKERVELLGGSFGIYSELGGGTKVMVEVPLLGDEGGADGKDPSFDS